MKMEIKSGVVSGGGGKLSESSVTVNPFPPSTMSECLRTEAVNVFVKKFVHFYGFSRTRMGHFRSLSLLQNKITAFQYISLRKWNDG